MRAHSCILTLISLVLLFTQACKNDGKQTDLQQEEPTLRADNPLMLLHYADKTGLDFVNYIEETHENNPTNNINIYNGGGVATADFNVDGLPDLYFVNCNGPNRLFINQGNLKFADKTAGSGLDSADGFETAVTIVDINTDGRPDIYLCRAGSYPPEQCRNRLFINQGNLKFTEEAAAFGLDIETRSTGANFFDYDLDGDLDVYILNYPQSFNYTAQIESEINPNTKKYEPVLKPKTPLDSDRLYRNDNGKFINVSQKAGIENFAYGLSITVSDFNHDNYPDIYVGNDFIQPDILYINNKNGTFSNKLKDYLAHCTQHTMGVDIADIDNDGLVDFTGLDMLPLKNYRQKTTLNISTQTRYNHLTDNGYFESKERNVLQRNNGNGSFSDLGCLAGIYKTDWSWSALFMDIDNDGFKDLGITNGYRREVTDFDFINFTFADIKSRDLKEQFPNIQDLLAKIPTYKIRNFLYKNNGDWTFTDMSGKWVTMPPSWSNGATYADFDNDGDLDWVINNLEEKPFLYENLSSQKSGNSYFQLFLEGDPKNPMAIGAKATLISGDQRQYQELTLTRGIFSSVQPILHFGTGKATNIDRIEVRWPNGKYTILQNIKTNQRITLKQAEATATQPPAPATTTLFKPLTNGIDFQHVENNYRDFDHFFLLPWKLSDLGPFITQADFNGDKIEDFFIGNSFDSPAAIYMGTANGGFNKSKQAAIEADKIYEDQQAVAFDADNDKDIDLFVVSGGWEATNPIAWQNRLYINDGKGNFSKAQGVPPLPDVAMSATALDYDADGDQDLIVAGRCAPGKYPTTPRTSVLRNDQSKFTDVTAQVGGALAPAGMVTSILSSDLNQDGKPEVICAGEWMPIRVFGYVGTQFSELTEQFGFKGTDGLWSALLVDDLDSDGDPDLVAGNWGLNTRLEASSQFPLRMFGADFDKNGSIEPIPAYYEEGKLYPLYRKDNMIKQMPILKKKYLYAKAYGSATVEDAFGADALKSAQNLYAYTLASTWFENQNGRFIAHRLPLQAQVSPTNSIIHADLTGDGKKDLFLVGNKFGVEVETGRCDAGVSCLLAGDGKGNFTWVPNHVSGIYANQDARDAALFTTSSGKTTLLVANNNSRLQIWQKQP